MPTTPFAEAANADFVEPPLPGGQRGSLESSSSANTVTAAQQQAEDEALLSSQQQQQQRATKGQVRSPS